MPRPPEFCLCASSGDSPRLVSHVEPQQQALEVRVLVDDLKVQSGSQGGRIATSCPILIDPIPVQQNKRVFELPPARMTAQITSSLLDNGQGIAAVPRPDVQMHVKSLFVATSRQKTRERTFALGLGSYKYGPPWLDQSRAPHRPSTDPGNAAQHTGAVLGI